MNLLPSINVVIADDHAIFRDGLKLMFNYLDKINLVGEAADGEELFKVVCEKQPDVVLTDIKMPILDGIKATIKIKAQYPAINIIGLSMFDDEHLIGEMLEAGANGYLLKNADKSEIEEAIRAVYDNQTYYCKHTTPKLAQVVAFAKNVKRKQLIEAELTNREKAIIYWTCKELTAKEISEKVYLSSRTIEGYRQKILDKLGVKNTAGMVIEAIRLGIYSPEDQSLPDFLE
jgi:DNA-binding NarL/FixJ family response regulator